MTLPIAHAGHWITTVAYFVPVVAFLAWLAGHPDPRAPQSRAAGRGARAWPRMSSGTRRVVTATALACAGSIVFPAAALAHGLAGGYDPNRPVPEYLWLGFWHMVAGWDHLLFIAGVILLSESARTAAKLISLFALGHSLTLLTATLAGWRLDPMLVDAVIALSLVYVGVLGLRGEPRNVRVMAATVFGFGLVHGLGLSTRLQDLGLPDGGLVIRVVLFNVGVEVGQLVALAVMVGVEMLVVRRLRRPAEAQRPAFAMLTVAGLVAAAVISFPAGEPETVARGSACVERQVQPPQSLAGGHPPKRFYGPSESAPAQDLAHVVGDGIVVVRYRPDLAERHIQALRQFATTGGRYVIAAPDRAQLAPVRAVAAARALTCTKVDRPALASFRDDWLATLRP